LKRGKFSYTTDNHLSSYLYHIRNERMFETGEKVRLKDVEEELATYCELSPKSITDIKRGENQPSLPVAMRIATFFNVRVDEIFFLKTKEELLMEQLDRIAELGILFDNEVLDELNGDLTELEAEVDKRFPQLKDNPNYIQLHDFYMKLNVTGIGKEIEGWVAGIKEELEEIKERQSKKN